jgi:microcystin-dependent protein
MGTPYVGEIRMFAGNFAPASWAFCQGQVIPISENNTLFALIGTTYGGDGQSTFALPDLRGRLPMHMGQGTGLPAVTIGQAGGVESVTLTTQQIPSHPHGMHATGTAGQLSPSNALPTVASGGASGLGTYQPAGGAVTTLSNTMLRGAGQNQPHENRQPYLCVSFIISLFGIFPSQT